MVQITVKALVSLTLKNGEIVESLRDFWMESEMRNSYKGHISDLNIQ